MKVGLIKICLVGCKKILRGVVVLLGKVRSTSYEWNCAQNPKSETKRFVGVYLGEHFGCVISLFEVDLSMVAFVSESQTVC